MFFFFNFITALICVLSFMLTLFVALGAKLNVHNNAVRRPYCFKTWNLVNWFSGKILKLLLPDVSF